jgi:hypothetical protein
MSDSNDNTKRATITGAPRVNAVLNGFVLEVPFVLDGCDVTEGSKGSLKIELKGRWDQQCMALAYRMLLETFGETSTDFLKGKPALVKVEAPCSCFGGGGCNASAIGNIDGANWFELSHFKHLLACNNPTNGRG